MVGFMDRKETKMSICPCGYWWADCDEDGTPISLEYCHYEGPAEWAPCEQDDYYAELAAEEEELRAEAEAAAEEYEKEMMEQAWNELFEATMEAMSEPAFEEYGEPYDYAEF